MKLLYYIFLATAMLLVGCKEEKKVPSKGNVLLKCNPEINAEIFFKGKSLGFTPKKLSGKAVFYSLLLKKQGYEPMFVNFKMALGKNKDVTIKPVRETGTILINSIPIGADVLQNTKVIGTTPLILHNLKCQSYNFQLRKNGFATQTINFNIVDARPFRVNTTLYNNLGTIKITSNPQKAKVYLNAKLIGFTPLETEVEDGLYNLTISAANYNNVTDKLLVMRNKRYERHFNLNLRSGIFTIKSTPEKAKLYLDEKYMGETPITLSDLTPNKKYKIELKKDFFAPHTQVITAIPGKSIPFDIKLIKNVGTLELVVNPAGVSVFLNNKFITKTIADGSPNISKVVRINNLQPGKYRVKVTHKLAVPDSKSKIAIIKAGKVTRLAKINLWIPNTEITLKDGSVRTGVFIRETNDTVVFSHEEGISYGIKKSIIKSIKKLKIND